MEATLGLASARYGLAMLLGPDGQPCAMAHRGMSDTEVAALAHLPTPAGVIGAGLMGQTLRLADLTQHPNSAGYPAGHPGMAALLGVPVLVAGRVVGGLYLTRALHEDAFTHADQLCVIAAAEVAGASLQACEGLSATAGAR